MGYLNLYKYYENIVNFWEYSDFNNHKLILIPCYYLKLVPWKSFCAKY